MVVEAAIAAAAVVLTSSFYYIRSDFGHYSIGTFGVERRVRRYSVQAEGHQCRDCHEDIEIGERRRYYRAVVVAGAEVYRYGGGTARYCYDHAELSVRDELEPVETFDNLPLWLQVTLPFFELLVEPISAGNVEDDEAFDNVTSSVGDAFSLLPIMVIILIAAFFIRLLKGTRPTT